MDADRSQPAIRTEIIALLSGGRRLSLRELSHCLEEWSLSAVHYHVKMLVGAKVIAEEPAASGRGQNVFRLASTS